jgi:hypothetical protein
MCAKFSLHTVVGREFMPFPLLHIRLMTEASDFQQYRGLFLLRLDNAGSRYLYMLLLDSRVYAHYKGPNQAYINTKANTNERRPPSKTRIFVNDLCSAPEDGEAVAAAAADESELWLAVLLVSPDSDSPPMPLMMGFPRPRVDVLVPVASKRFEPVSRRVSPLTTVVNPGLIV